MQPYNLTDEQKLLRQRLTQIEAVFNVDEIIARKTHDTQAVARYYNLNRLAYALAHSRDGFVHMGISRDGIFKADDFYEQGRMIQAYIDERQAKDVLELAAGKAATTRYLAARNPDVHFYGMDLPSGQLNAKAKSTTNLTLNYGDFHDLSSMTDGSVDIVYIIEALCHATDRRRVIAEVSRVLRPGGCFIVFDGYTAKQRDAMTELERYASDLTFTSMMVDTSDLQYGSFKKELLAEGFTIKHEDDLSQYVLPSMKRLESNSRRFIKHKYAAGLVMKLIPNVIVANAIAGYLMPITTEMGIHRYWFTVAQK